MGNEKEGKDTATVKIGAERIYERCFDRFLKRFRALRRAKHRALTVSETADELEMHRNQVKKYLQVALDRRLVRETKVFYDKGTLKLKSPQFFWDPIDE